MLSKLARAGMSLAAIVLVGTGLALAETSATPAPKTVVAQAAPEATATPNPFTYRGYIRAYDFTRQNAYSGHSAVNQQSFNAAISLHGDYNFSNSGFDLGAAYLYANPLSNCTSPVSHLTPPCGKVAAPNLNPDDTLPGFELSTLYEAYGQYKGNGLFVKVGDVLGAQAWTPASDTRLKPATYTGGYLQYKLNPQFNVELGDYTQWECRTCSNFNNYTLITDSPTYPYPGANGLPTTLYDPAKLGLSNSGVTFGRIGYTGSKSAPLTMNLSDYAFNNIANLVWFDAKYPFAAASKPFVALQAGSESNQGSALVGKISSTVFGMQAGVNVLPNVTITGGFDTIPIKTDTLSAATMASGGVKCNTNHTIGLISAANASNVNFPYWLPSGGTGSCSVNSDGSTNVYYGGLASPYTDSYTSDPLFTTEMTQGMVERRSPGTSYKLQATFTSDDKRFVAYINHGWFDYNNNAYAQGTQETDFDAQYYFKPLPTTGLYKGFSFRYRYGNRDESTFAGGTATGLFVYNRFQAEYDF